MLSLNFSPLEPCKFKGQKLDSKETGMSGLRYQLRAPDSQLTWGTRLMNPELPRQEESFHQKLTRTALVAGSSSIMTVIFC